MRELRRLDSAPAEHDNEIVPPHAAPLTQVEPILRDKLTGWKRSVIAVHPLDVRYASTSVIHNVSK